MVALTRAQAIAQSGMGLRQFSGLLLRRRIREDGGQGVGVGVGGGRTEDLHWAGD